MATKKILTDIQVDGDITTDSVLVGDASGHIAGSTLTNIKFV